MPKTLLVKIQASDESDMEALAGQVDQLMSELEDPGVPVERLRYDYAALTNSTETEWLWNWIHAPLPDPNEIWGEGSTLP